MLEVQLGVKHGQKVLKLVVETLLQLSEIAFCHGPSSSSYSIRAVVSLPSAQFCTDLISYTHTGYL